MNKQIAEKIRELIQVEVIAGIAGDKEDESGYRGHNQKECREADLIFSELLIIIEEY